ncbi:MAG: GNAT family N-acetyltransferase [Nocardioides sp.]|nr:GNAT family N-acetyltransferase [Nocardioides sp.]
MTDPTLPDGLTTRPLTQADARAVFEVYAAQEQADTGEVNIEEADIVSDWSKPSHDLASRSVGVLDGDRIVATAELMGRDRADVAVHPEWRGRGIGTWLAAWLRDLGRRTGTPVLGMPVPQGSPGDRLLESLGYHVRWTSWVLRLPPEAEIATRELPEGYAVREATPEDYPAMHDVLEDAFLEWSEREREPYDDFAASILQRPGFEPWLMRVATDPSGRVVGASVIHLAEDCVYIARLAVDRDQRGRGLAQALLVDSFAAGRAHGATVFELSTDSRTGALGLYEKVGMQVHAVWVNRAVHLTPETGTVPGEAL